MMANMMTASDEEPIYDEPEDQLLYGYVTPTEEDGAADSISVEVDDDDSSPPQSASIHDCSAGDNRHTRSNDEIVAVESRQTTDDRRRNVASGNLAVVETNRAPVLRKLDRKAILRFVESRDRYLRTFADADTAGIPRSLVSMIDRTILETICECDLDVDDATVTDDELIAWMTQALKDDRSQDSHIERKMKKMKMDLKIDSPFLRVTDLFVQFNKIVKDNGWKHLFEDEDGKKMKVRFLNNAIEPKELKTIMKNKMKLEPRFSKSPVAFMTLLREKAVNYEETRTLKTDDEKEKKNMRKRGRIDDKKTRDDKKTHNSKKKKDDNNMGRATDRSLLKCFNCGKFGHAAWKCPEGLSKREVHTLLKKHDNKYSKKSSNYLLVCRIGRSPDANRQIDVRISEGLYVPGILDSGATDMSLIPLRIAQMAMRNDPAIETERLREPIRLRLGDNRTEVEATECVTLDIGLRTKAGEIITRQRKCLIWDVPSEEIILGGDLLEELGIEPKVALDALIVKKRAKTVDEQTRNIEELFKDEKHDESEDFDEFEEM